jgi:hypothetical protein
MIMITMNMMNKTMMMMMMAVNLHKTEIKESIAEMFRYFLHPCLLHDNIA